MREADDFKMRKVCYVKSYSAEKRIIQKKLTIRNIKSKQIGANSSIVILREIWDTQMILLVNFSSKILLLSPHSLSESRYACVSQHGHSGKLIRQAKAGRPDGRTSLVMAGNSKKNRAGRGSAVDRNQRRVFTNGIVVRVGKPGFVGGGGHRIINHRSSITRF